MGIVDLVTFRASVHGNMPFYLGGSASSVDHCGLHPDLEVNEVWISNIKGWETIVVVDGTRRPDGRHGWPQSAGVPGHGGSERRCGCCRGRVSR
ncbi:MAG: hypothetical protein WEE36_09975 [Acidimicrobiia bacterium]